MGLKGLVRRPARAVGRGVARAARRVWSVLRTALDPLWRGARRIARPLVQRMLVVLAPVGHWLGRVVRNADGTPAPPGRVAFLGVGIVAVLAAAFAVVAATWSTAPLPPLLPVDTVDAVGDAVFDHDQAILFLAEPGGGVRALAHPEGVVLAWCPDSEQVEGADGRAWDRRGRSLDGGPSLHVHPTRVHDDLLYLDTTTHDQAPPGDDVDPELACGR